MHENQSNSCSICQSALTETIVVREMRIGLREEHAYLHCISCGFLELKTVPGNLDTYYKSYYTAQKPYYEISGMRRLFWKVRSALYDSVLHPIFHRWAFNTILDWKYRLKLKFNATILDVGCGNGDILFEFYKNGFKNLKGIDPFPPSNALKKGLPFQIMEGGIFDVPNNDQFDLIMMHHSFEHMHSHEQVLIKAKQLLRPEGSVFIRMPIVNRAFQDYRENWVQIDAPRHLGIHSVKSFEMLADRCGFKVLDVFFDSTSFQFLGSEQNKADIDFFAVNSYKTDKAKSIFNDSDFIKFNEMATQYNQNGWGDQAGFILKLV
jgi:SAM-dependent methyltransferase